MTELLDSQSNRQLISMPYFSSPDNMYVCYPSSLEHVSKTYRRVRLRKTGENSSQQSYRIFNTISTRQVVSNFIRKLKYAARLLPHKVIYHENYTSGQNQKQLQWCIRMAIFNPTDTLIMIWEFYSIMVSTFAVLYIPLLISFTSMDAYLQSLFIVTIILDMFMSLNKPLLDKGEIISDRDTIFNHYIRKYSLIDLYSILFWAINNYFSHEAFVLLSIIALILNVIRFQAKVSHLQESSLYLSYTNFVDLARLIITICFFAHFMACIWHYVGANEDLNNTWIKAYGYQNESALIRYNASFYWSTMTMTTIGYGDIVPQNYQETVTANILMLVSTCIFGYSMNSIGMIVTNMNITKVQYTYHYFYNSKQLTIINQYMKKHAVANKIQSRVRNYLKYYISWQNHENSTEINSILDKFPKPLQEDLDQDIKQQIIQKTFLKKFTEPTRIAIAQIMEFVQYTPNEYIYKQGDLTDKHLYFILEGEVTILEQNSGYNLNRLSINQVLGDYQFITGFPPKSTAVSSSFSLLCRMNRGSFLSIIANTLDFEQFKSLQDDTIFNNLFIQPCNLCKKNDHQNIDCPLINFRSDMERLVKRQNFDFNVRQEYFRKRGRINTRNEMQIVQSSQRELVVEDRVYEVQISDNFSNDDAVSDFDLGLPKTYFTVQDSFQQQQDIEIPILNVNSLEDKHKSPIQDKSPSDNQTRGFRRKTYLHAQKKLTINQDEIFELPKLYTHYFPQHNKQALEYTGKLTIYKNAAKYMFFHFAQRIATRIRRRLIKQYRTVDFRSSMDAINNF